MIFFSDLSVYRLLMLYIIVIFLCLYYSVACFCHFKLFVIVITLLMFLMLLNMSKMEIIWMLFYDVYRCSDGHI